MENLIAGVFRLVIAIIFGLMALILVASLLVAGLFGACLLAIRYAWARLTGKPVAPFVFSTFTQKQSAQWGQFRSKADQWTSKATGRSHSVLKENSDDNDVTDVQVKSTKPKKSTDSPL